MGLRGWSAGVSGGALTLPAVRVGAQRVESIVLREHRVHEVRCADFTAAEYVDALSTVSDLQMLVADAIPFTRWDAWLSRSARQVLARVAPDVNASAVLRVCDIDGAEDYASMQYRERRTIALELALRRADVVAVDDIGLDPTGRSSVGEFLRRRVAELPVRVLAIRNFGYGSWGDSRTTLQRLEPVEP